ncbi:hypothetical protein ACFL2O_02460 [Thermodesulfobacteriota bacterium]
MRKSSIKIIFIYFVIIFTYSIAFLGSDFIHSIGYEDGPIENMGAFFFLLASVMFFVSYFFAYDSRNKLWSFSTKRNLFYILLALLFFVCFGEEISWGQRIFGWNTPETWNRINTQGETSFHNLWIFQSRDASGNRKSFLALMLNMNRLFSVFWLTYCIIVPLVNKLSHRAKKLLNKINLPISPLWIGGLFLVNYAIFHIIVDVVLGPSEAAKGSLNELKEANYALIFSIFAYHELRKAIRSRKSHQIR